MALSFKARKRLAILILVLGLPAYVVVAITIVNLFDRPPLWLEFVIYAGLGILWAVPLKRVFEGIGQHDPDDPRR